jgi:hypothetical protein
VTTLVIINEVSCIPREEKNGPEDQVDCLVPQCLLKMSEGLALPERCIIKTYFDVSPLEHDGRTRHCVACVVWHVLGRAINNGLVIPRHAAHVPDWNAKIPEGET